jgi:hypothetical protein
MSTNDFESSLESCEMMGYGTAEYLRTWFGDLDPDAGSVLFVRKIKKQTGGVTFKAVKGFRPDQIEEAAKFVESFPSGDDLYIKTSTFDRDKITDRMERGDVVVGSKNEVHTVCGFALDVDAGKRDSYASQDDVWQAIYSMPVQPTMVVLSGQQDHGFHVYYRFRRPIVISVVEDVEQLNHRASAWRDLLIDKIAERLTARGAAFERDKLVDRTYGVDRVLRPVGVTRVSGDAVRFAAFDVDRRFSLTELTAPNWAPVINANLHHWPRAEESVIDHYFSECERAGESITIERLLLSNGYERVGTSTDWIRSDSETGSRSLAEGEVINGLPGVNVFSGGCAPLKCNDDTNDVGRRYSLYALWVAFEFGDPDLDESWRAAAKFCHDYLKPSVEEVFEPVAVDPNDEPKIVCNGDKIGKTVIPRCLKDIVEQVRKCKGNWPKACAGDLFAIDKGKAVLLNTPAKLFGWLQTGAQTIWHDSPGTITKSEFFSQLPHMVEQYEAIETLPHFPPLENHYYAADDAGRGSGKTLERLLDYFSLATTQDRQLAKAMIVTMFWGGSAGARPLFAIDATDGTGTGKSSLAFKIGSLAGGVFQFDARTEERQIRSHLATSTAADGRMVLIDNVKQTRISNATIESMITAPDIGGHAMFRGYRSRPNHLVWVLTMNGVSLSRDLAHRTVKILVSKPTERKNWNESIDHFIKVNWDFLIADIAAFFELPTTELADYGRWSGWEHAVLSRLEDPDGLRMLIKERASSSDEDQATSEGLLEYFGEQLRTLGFDIATDIVHIPTIICSTWTSEATGRDMTKSAVSGMLTMLRESGSLRGLIPNPNRKHGRGWLWHPQNKAGNVFYDLQTRIDNAGFR